MKIDEMTVGDLLTIAADVEQRYGVQADWLAVDDADVLRIWLSKFSNGQTYTAYTYVDLAILTDEKCRHLVDEQIAKLKKRVQDT